MRHIPPTPSLGSFAAVALVFACTPAGSPRLEGHWHGMRADGVASDAQGAANTFAAGMELDVKGDTITVSTPKDRQTGHYKVVHNDKNSVAIVTDKDGPRDPQTFTFVDERTMKWAVLDGKTILFVKR